MKDLWKSVEVELPPHNTEVLVFSPDTSIGPEYDIAVYDVEFETWNEMQEYLALENVTHWQPLHPPNKSNKPDQLPGDSLGLSEQEKL